MADNSRNNGGGVSNKGRGDARMRKATEARLSDPTLSLVDALRRGGFVFKAKHPTCDDPDADGISLQQRKNQLCRRIRREKENRQEEESGGGGGGGGGGGSGGVPNNAGSAAASSSASARASVSGKSKSSSRSAGRKRILERDERANNPDQERRQESQQASAAAVQLEGGDDSSGSSKRARKARPVITPPLPSLSDLQATQAAFVHAQQQAAAIPSVSSLLTASSGTGLIGHNSVVAAPANSNNDANVAARLYDWMRRNTSDFMSFLHLSQSAGLVPGPPANTGTGCVPNSNNMNTTCSSQSAAASTITSREAPSISVDVNDEAIQLFRSTFASKLGGTQFTEDQVKREWANLSPAQREYTDAIVRGHRPVSSIPIPRDSFMMLTLIMRMRIEMTSIPSAQGGDMVRTAQDKCVDLEKEFGDDRLEMFLKREGMDPRKAAHRLANYWNFRTTLFGLDKCYLPFTLRGALRDDLIAMSTGVLRLVDLPDDYGRRIILSTPGRNNGVGYDSNSMVRAMMYVLEAMLEGPEAIENGFVCIENNAETSIWNWDKELHDAFVNLEKEILPFEWCGIHVCSYPSLLMKLIKPVALAMGDERTRHRLVFHEGVGYMSSLQDYGVEKQMLPTDVGGTAALDWCQWVQSRLEAGL